VATWLSRRERRPERMDDPALPPAEHRRALRGLATINAWSRSDALLWPAVRAACRERPGHAIRVLDVASGAGDVLFRLERRAKAAGLSIDWLGVDASPVAVDHGRAEAERTGSRVRFAVADALAGPLPEADVACSSLFLHHLDEGPARLLLRRKVEAAPLALVNDLHRCRLGYLAAVVVTRVLSRSPVVHYDGPVSVAGAFTAAEALALARSAGWAEATVARRWPFRYLLTGRRP